MAQTRTIHSIPMLASRGGLADRQARLDTWPLQDSQDPRWKAWLQILRLKRLLRRGWLRVGVPEESCESVAEHCQGVAMLCLLYADSHPESEGRRPQAYRCALMALAHELGEIHTGDLTPHDQVSKAEKHRMEEAAIHQVLDDLDGETSGLFWELWQEYEAQATLDARFVKQMDLLEMGSQAAWYMADGYQGAKELLDSARRGLADSQWAGFLQ